MTARRRARDGSGDACADLERVLIRNDGSRWTVTSVQREDFCFHVSARPRTGFADGGENVNGDSADRRPEALTGAPLERGERIEWRTPDGDVVWSMRCPVGPVGWRQSEA